MTDKTIPKAIPLSAFIPDSRKADAVVCYSGAYSDGRYKTWNDFLAGTAALRKQIESTGKLRWIIHCNDYWYFLLAYTALLQCKKEVVLTANIAPAYIAEIAGADAAGTAFITDERDALELLQFSFYVPDITAESLNTAEPGSPAERDKLQTPFINADDTAIIMYTSGTTGQPKAVKQRLTEFENDNAFILSKWGEELLKRKVCSTVSPHHIYGLLFSVMLPFTAGVPFRRERIMYPEIFRQLTDYSYLLITVPAMLKRAVDEAAFTENIAAGFGLRSPWIFTSGGAVPPETAAAVEQVFGFWPLEVYGSTETSGIAWRQSKSGLEWTPFDNAQVWKNSEGLLVIKSPYIRDEDGFTTGDLAELLPDGRFLLKGRSDSIVKIEEKRISLPEVENRIIQSSLVSETAVLALEGRRQYLAAVVVLNEKGKKQFAESKKNDINTWFRSHLQQFFENVFIPKCWRYPEALPRNPQGKLLKQELEALFRTRIIMISQGITGTVIERAESKAVIEFAVGESCPYFDGHFPGFKILPAVAQFAIVCSCAEQLLETGFSVHSAGRLKFTNIISPNTTIRLELKLEKPTALRYSFTSPLKDISYAAGTINCQTAGR